MGQSLATKYRPRTFEDTLGQTAVIKILKRQLETHNISNCYLFCGPSGDGKAQPLTSKILTPDGYKLMSDIQIGDSVIDGKGNATKVLGVFPQGERDVYKITLDDRTSFEVADNHLNRICYYDHNNREYLTKDLTTLELIDFKNKYKDWSVFIPVADIDCWKNDNLPIDPYLLGCLIGDGSLHNNLAVTSADQFILDKINDILLRDWSMSLKPTSSKYSYRISSIYTNKYEITYKNKIYTSVKEFINKLVSEGYPAMDFKTIKNIVKNNAPVTLKKYPELANVISIKENNKQIWSDKDAFRKILNQLNLCVKSTEKRIPKNYLFASKAARLALLQGLMDTDGTAVQARKSNFTDNMIGGAAQIGVSNKGLAQDIAFLCRSLGCSVTTSTKTNIKYQYKYKDIDEVRLAKDFYKLRIKSPSSFSLFTLPRKFDRYVKPRFEPRRIIKDIEYVRKDVCQCIYVESDDHTYITDNETITHNTTIARALSNYINEGKGSIIEIDGASNNGVDNVRSIIDQAKERSIDSEYKIFLVDECHMITTAGWNAFLKCLEEPPKYTIFMFCTTNPEKIPDTILNRVMRFNLTKVDTNLIRQRLEYICAQEGFTNYNEACDFIAKLASGGVRDAIAMLEKCANYDPNLCIENVLNCLGTFSYDTLFNLTGAILNNDEGYILEVIDQYYNSGSDLKLFIEQYLDFVIDLTKYCLFKDLGMIKIPISLKDRCDGFSNIPDILKFSNNLVEKVLNIKNAIKYDTSIKTTIEAMFIALSRTI